QARGDEDVRVAPSTRRQVGRLDLVLTQGRGGDLDRRRRARKPVALEEALDGRLEVALGVARGLGQRVDHLRDDLGGTLRVEAPGLELDVAALGHHVRRGAALDPAYVRGRLVVQAADPQGGYRAGRGHDRVVAV